MKKYYKRINNFDNKKVDWYDFGCLVNLGYKWIEEDCFKDSDINE